MYLSKTLPLTLKKKYHKIIQININSWFFLQDLPNIDALLIMIGKDVIHKSRINKVAPSLTAMMNALKMKAKKEHALAKTKNDLESLETKWGELKRIPD